MLGGECFSNDSRAVDSIGERAAASVDRVHEPEGNACGV
jgi:hypothetical protein